VRLHEGDDVLRHLVAPEAGIGEPWNRGMGDERRRHRLPLDARAPRDDQGEQAYRNDPAGTRTQHCNPVLRFLSVTSIEPAALGRNASIHAVHNEGKEAVVQTPHGAGCRLARCRLDRICRPLPDMRDSLVNLGTKR
jgi:hypothetical protein